MNASSREAAGMRALADEFSLGGLMSFFTANRRSLIVVSVLAFIIGIVVALLRRV